MNSLAVQTQLSQHTQEALVKNHAPLVKKLAYHLLGRLPPTVQIDDLMQVGMMGLLEATKNYDMSKGATFETYASIRIKGFMLDEVRKNDWVPRSVYRNSRLISRTTAEVEHQLGRTAKISEIAEKLGINLGEYHDMLQEAVTSQIQGFEDMGVGDNEIHYEDKMDEPANQVMQEDTGIYLSEILQGLPKKEQLVLALYYQHELNLKEIGDILQVSESRISQILSQALNRAKSKLTINQWEF